MTFREHTTLGKTGLKVSRLGVGAGYGVPASACERAFHEFGVNLFYWSMPRRGGMKRAIQNLAPKHRDELVVVVQSYDHTGFLIETLFERQLRVLGIDRADIFLLGWFNRVPPRRVLDAAASLKAKGKARYIAMSGHHRPTFGKLAQMKDNPIDVFMVRYNAAHRGAETDVFPHLPATNPPGFVGYTTTCWGKLLTARNMPQGEQPMTATECYRFSLTSPHVDLCLIGPKDQHEMDEALRTLDDGPMDNEELERARRIGDYVHG